MKVNFKIVAGVLMLTVMSVLTSCLNDDTMDIVYYDDIAVKSVTFGTLYKTVNDTTTTSFTASSYPIQIDQINRRIYNTDSLPLGTRLDKVLLNVTTYNSAATLVRMIDDKNDTTYVNTSDTLDLSQKRTLLVVSTSGKYVCPYEINIVAHQQSDTTFTWNLMADANADIMQLSGIKAFCADGNICVVGTRDGEKQLWTSPVADGRSWTRSAIDLTGRDAVADGNKLVIVSMGDDIDCIYTAHNGAVYAKGTDGMMKVSTDNGATWRNDIIDADASLLPSADFTSTTIPSPINAEISRIAIYGKNDGGSSVWMRLIDSTMPLDRQESWIHVPASSSNPYYLPDLNNYSVARYGSDLILMGRHAQLGYFQMFKSVDSGLTWNQNSRYTLPDGFNAASASIVADDNNCLWIICSGTGQVWRGYLNGKVWSNGNTYFE